MLNRKSLVFIYIFIIIASYSFAQDFKPYEQKIEGTDITISMTPIPGGEFLMGSPVSEKGRNTDEGPQRKVKIDPFWMSTYEIDWQQYELFLEREIDKYLAKSRAKDVHIDVDGVSSATPPYIDMSMGMGKEGYPVINITQFAASTFAKWLSAKTGHFYRLPTEAEWEYACRAGSKTAYHFGNNEEELAKYGWYADNSEGKYHKVGSKEPNKWGLYDMHGNVSEWTLDQYDPEYYKAGEVDNPWNEPEDLYPRVIRGGAWDDNKEALRCAARGYSSATWKQLDPQLPKSLWWHTSAPFIGFRVVRPKEVPSKEEQERYWLKAVEEF